jgi:hypothetical protein
MSHTAHLQLDLSLDAAPEAELPARLHRLGLPADVDVTLTRNRTVLVSYAPSGGLRLHAGYAWAGDDVLAAIITFVRPRTSRADRVTARRRFLSFPVDRHVPSKARRRVPSVPDAHQPLLDRLARLHQILNERHFGGSLTTLPLRLSDRMQSRLGEFQAPGDGHSAAIVLSHRHLRRDGWTAAAETLLHEMIHQWQHETGLPLDHGVAFRRKARALGISPAATVPAGYIHSPRSAGTIA